MKIALLGGTGNLGKGLALRLSKLGYEVIVGSRKLEKAEKKAKEYMDAGGVDIVGMENAKAASVADIVFFTIPWEHAFTTAELLRNELNNKIVVSPLVPMEKLNDVFIYKKPSEGSAAEKLAAILESDLVVSAFHTVPANRFAELNEKLNWDVPVCGDNKDAKRKIMGLIEEMELRPLDAGPLSNSYLVESITPLILNIMVRNKLGEVGIKFV